jgi:hypothetical protein
MTSGIRTLMWGLGMALLLGVVGCAREARARVLPPTSEVTEWFGEGTTAEFNGNLLAITGPMEPEHIRGGGQLWARSGPYFFLFNVHIRDLMVEYPDIAAVRATVVTADGDYLASATLNRDRMNEFRWREALAQSSLAQRQGTENPRLIEQLVRFGQDNTEYDYGELAAPR